MLLISRDGKNNSERRLKMFYQKKRSAITCLFLDHEKLSYKKYNSDVDIIKVGKFNQSHGRIQDFLMVGGISGFVSKVLSTFYFSEVESTKLIFYALPNQYKTSL